MKVCSYDLMLKPKTNREELKRLHSTLMIGAEIRLRYATETCCSKNCIQNLIYGGSYGVGHKSTSSSSSTSSSASSSNNSRLASDMFLFCQQVGIPRDDIPVHPFDQFLEEVRKPFYELQSGVGSVTEANDQLRYYLVHKFTENRVYDPENKHNYLYIYQLHSLSRGIITICKTAYVIITGVSVQAIDYSQRLVRNNISAGSFLLSKSEEGKLKSKGETLKETFEQFGLDYNLYELNINGFIDVMKIPDSPTAFICVAYLAEWFELSGEQEVRLLRFIILLLRSLIVFILFRLVYFFK